MFQSIAYTSGSYTLVDTDFTEYFPWIDVTSIKQAVSLLQELYVIVRIYEQKGLPVVPNVLAFYNFAEERYGSSITESWLNTDCRLMGYYYSHVPYREKYFPEVLMKFQKYKVFD